MTTSIKNLFAAALILVTISTSAFAASMDTQKNVTVLSEVKNINKIVANGNVEVILVQAPTESVKVYDSYYAKNALVQEENGVLRISSFQKETLTVVVYIRNITAIEANDNAVVKTNGKINLLSLEVNLRDNAVANINTTTIDLYSAVNDNAVLKLSGSADEHYAVLGSKAKLSMDQFNANSSSLNAMNPIIAKVETKKAATLPTDDYDFSK
jgi:hypothetical protein